MHHLLASYIWLQCYQQDIIENLKVLKLTLFFYGGHPA